jgi:hypothetical protein
MVTESNLSLGVLLYLQSETCFVSSFFRSIVMAEAAEIPPLAQAAAIVVPSAKIRLASLFGAVAALNGFLMNVRFIAPWTAWTPPNAEEEAAISAGIESVAEEIRAIDLAIW